ncbi:MAG TPA: hypothetical protein VF619_07960 [Allosphingosinicella sp.]|jgi:hypothetical protein
MPNLNGPRGFCLGLAALGSAWGAPALAQEPSARFAAEALRICVGTRAAPAAVRQLAAAERWMPADSKALPGESSITVGGNPNVTYRPSNVWTLDKDGLPLTVLIYDVPARPKMRHCEISAWDLDSDAVDRALKSDPRVKGGFLEPGAGMRRYSVKKPNQIFRYGAGKRDSRTIHVLMAH